MKKMLSLLCLVMFSVTMALADDVKPCNKACPDTCEQSKQCCKMNKARKDSCNKVCNKTCQKKCEQSKQCRKENKSCKKGYQKKCKKNKQCSKKNKSCKKVCDKDYKKACKSKCQK